MVTKLCKQCGTRRCMQGGFEVCTVCFNNKIQSPDITWRKNYFPSTAPKPKKTMKQCIKLDVRIDLEDGDVNISISSAYAPIHRAYLETLQLAILKLSQEQYKELFDSKEKIKAVGEKAVISMPATCSECVHAADLFAGPNDARSHKEGCSRIGNDPRQFIWLENSYRKGTLRRPVGG